MGRLNKDRQKKLEPKRIQTALRAIKSLGFDIESFDDTKIVFIFNRSKIQYFAYSGWHTGKTIKDGRGLKNLLKQLKND